MKVLVVRPSGGAFNYITKAFLNAFNDVGIEAKYWNGDKKEFLKFNPDLYIGCSGHRQEVPKSWDGKIAIHVNPYGDRLEPQNGVDVNEPKEAVEWTLKQNPDVVFGYGLQQEEDTFWSKWKNHGIPFVGVPTAGDTTLYYPDQNEVDYKIAFLGGRWQYKGHNINKWLLPSINKLGDKISVMGWGGWQGVKQYEGQLPESDCGRKFLSSAIVGPCVCEPHTSKYGIDFPERFFKVALCGTLPILDYVDGFDKYCDNYVMAKNPDDYYNLLLNYSSNPDYIDEGKKLADKIRKEVLNKHTYLHRMKHLCFKLGLTEAVSKFDARIKLLV